MKTKLLAVSSVLVLTACGGGGGGGGTSATLNAFTRMSDVTANQSVRILGQSVEAVWSGNGSAVTAVASPSAVTTSTTIDGTYNSSGYLNKLVITTPHSTTTFDGSAGSTFGTLVGSAGTIGAVVKNDGTAFAVYPYSPLTLGWEYQTFGIWETGRGSASGVAGAVSAGVVTSGSSVPTSGSATFSGYSGGAYVTTAGADYLTRSTATLVTNFATRSIAFSTTGTVKALPSNVASSVSDSNLNMSGTLTWSSGVNAFSGSVLTTGGTLIGTATGRFYGPSATEAGGVFFLAPSSGVERYAGAFGAKR